MSLYQNYYDFTATTAVYPKEVETVYLALGLCSEAAECVEACNYPRRAGGRQWFDTEEQYDRIGSETGDVQWYIARLCHAYNISFPEVVSNAKIEYRPMVHSLHDSTVLLTIACGLIAGKVKKQIRDGATWTGEQREETRRDIASLLSKCVEYSMYIADQLHSVGHPKYGRYDHFLTENRKKLEARQSRGTIRGSGDER